MQNDFIVETYYDYYDTIAAPPLAQLSGAPESAVEEAAAKVFAETLPGLMKQMERFSNTPGKFLLGDRMFVCDFVFGSFLTDVVFNPMCYGRPEFAQFADANPWLKTYHENVKNALNEVLAKRRQCPI